MGRRIYAGGKTCGCPLLAISRRSEGLAIRSALPPKADITGEKLHRSLKADIQCPLSP
jgi:hypothetical protein